MNPAETDPEIWAEIERELDKIQQAEGIFGPINAPSAGQSSEQVSEQVFERIPLVVGVSGGADSVCLLAALIRLTQRPDPVPLSLHVAHLDHGLRPSSAQDAAFVEELANAWGLPMHLKRLPSNTLTETGQNVEAAAREIRYGFLAQVAREITPPGHSPRIATAHTQDDQAETLLMQLIRGAGLSGLAAMRPITALRDEPAAVQPALPQNDHPLNDHNGTSSLSSELAESGEIKADDVTINDVTVDTGTIDAGVIDSTVSTVYLVRPFLYVPRTLLLRTLHDAQIPWQEDPTNQDLGYTRNWLRHEILPRLAERQPGIKENLGRTAAILAGEADRAVALNRQTLQRLVLDQEEEHPGQAERIVLDLDEWRKLPVAEQRGVLRQAWLRLGNSLDVLGFDHIETMRLRAAAQDEQGGPYTLVDGYVWSLLDGRLAIHGDEKLPVRLRHPYLSRAAVRANLASGHVKRDVPEGVPGETPSLTLALPLAAKGQPLPLLTLDRWQLWADMRPVKQLSPTWKANPDPWQAFLHWDQARSLSLTVHQPGMQIAPLGMAGQHKSVGDLFTDCKVPQALRAGWPILLDEEEERVLWVCGLRISHHACITSATQQVLHLRWARE